MNLKKRLTAGLVAITLLTMLGGITTAQAQSGGTPTPAPAAEEAAAEEGSNGTDNVENIIKKAFDNNQFVTQIAQFLPILHRVFAPSINFFAFKIGDFLGNEHIFGLGMGEMLKKIWVISRNLVNIIFVFILLWIALRQIIGDTLGMETKPIVKELLKIAAFLVLVNFSWLGTKVVLDAANVITNVTFSIPSGVGGVGVDYEECTINQGGSGTSGMCMLSTLLTTAEADQTVLHYAEGSEGCVKMTEIYNKLYDSKTGKERTMEDLTDAEIASANLETGEIAGISMEDREAVVGKTIMCWGNFDLFKYDQNSSVVFLTYGMARIQNLVVTSSKSIDQLAVGTIFSLLMQTAFLISLFVLFAILVVRMAFLWLFVGFAPIMVLLSYLTSSGASLGFAEKWNIRSFAHWAFVPAMMGVVFSVSFIMISVGQQNSQFGMYNGGAVYGRLAEWQSIFTSIGTLDQLIWMFVTLIVLWIGVFTVAKGLPYGGEFFGKIGDFGSTVATQIAKTPLLMPVGGLTDNKGQPVTAMSMIDSFKFDPTGLINNEMDADMAAMNKAAVKIKESPQRRDRISGMATAGNINGIASEFGTTTSALQGLYSKNPKELERTLENSGFSGGQKRLIMDAIRDADQAAIKQKEAAEAQTKAAQSASPAPVAPATGAASTEGKDAKP